MSDVAQAEVKICKACAERIPTKAKLCRHCNTWQNWPAFLTFSSTILALIVALVTVLTAAAPIFVKLVTPTEAVLNAQFLYFRDNVALFSVSNSGGKTGWVSKAQVNFASLIAENMRSYSQKTIDQVKRGKSLSEWDSQDKNLLESTNIPFWVFAFQFSDSISLSIADSNASYTEVSTGIPKTVGFKAGQIVTRPSVMALLRSPENHSCALAVYFVNSDQPHVEKKDCVQIVEELRLKEMIRTAGAP